MRSLAPLRMTAAPCAMHYNAGASESSAPAHHVPQTVLQTPLARAPRRTCVAPLFHLALPFLFGRYGLLRRVGPQLAVSRSLRLLLPRAASSLGCARPRLSGVSGRDLDRKSTRLNSSHSPISY